MRFRSLIAACVLPLAPLSVYGCSIDPTTEDLCGWLQNPNATNCVSEFHEDIKDKCGSVDKAAVSGTTTGAGGAEEQAESHYSKGTIAITRPAGRDAVDISCPAPDLVAAGVLAVPETHNFNLNQVLSSTPSTGCPQYSEIIPQAI